MIKKLLNKKLSKTDIIFYVVGFVLYIVYKQEIEEMMVWFLLVVVIGWSLVCGIRVLVWLLP